MSQPTGIDRVQASFSRASKDYEQHADIQRMIGLKLLDKLPSQQRIQTILDVGMGTGWLTEKIASRFPCAKTIGVDFAYGMVEQAKQKKIHAVLQASAEALPFCDHSIDLIVSNCMYQWVKDIDQAFSLNNNILRKNGWFCFSMFGQETFSELRTSFEACAKEGIVRLKMLSEFSLVERALRRAKFCGIDIRKEKIQYTFQDMFDLLRWLKTLGANRAFPQKFIRRDFLHQANAFYTKHFSNSRGVNVTFEVIWGRGRK
jgi:malonyl-CoA O-methyltransferase